MSLQSANAHLVQGFQQCGFSRLLTLQKRISASSPSPYWVRPVGMERSVPSASFKVSEELT